MSTHAAMPEYECTCHRDCCECEQGPESYFLDHDGWCHGCSRSGRWHAHADDPCPLHGEPRP
jgi:hypothetical protein